MMVGVHRISGVSENVRDVVLGGDGEEGFRARPPPTFARGQWGQTRIAGRRALTHSPLHAPSELRRIRFSTVVVSRGALRLNTPSRSRYPSGRDNIIIHLGTDILLSSFRSRS